MKKFIGIFIFILCIILTSCGSGEKMSLPDVGELSEVEISSNLSENKKKINTFDEIANLVEKIEESTKKTAKESVNDQPVNVENYIVLKFHFKSEEKSERRFYLYKRGNKAYAEEPYSGIWKLDRELYNEIEGEIDKLVN